MKVMFYASDTKENEHRLASALEEGLRASEPSARFEVRPMSQYEHPDEDTDVALMLGVKGKSKKCMDDHLALGKHTVYLDKGYIRYRAQGVKGPMEEYHRMSIDAFQPTEYFQKNRPDDRWTPFGIELRPRNAAGTYILFAGKSQKYCDWMGLGDANAYADRVAAWIRANTNKPILYRPKPSFKGFRPIPGTEYSGSDRQIYAELDRTWALVTHGSNAALDAVFYGVPAFLLGEDCITKALSNSDLRALDDPWFPEDWERYQWACDMSYCQFTLGEMASGVAWDVLKEELE